MQDMRQNWRFWNNVIDVDDILRQPETQKVREAETFAGQDKRYRISRIAWMTENNRVKSMLEPLVREAADVMDIDVEMDGADIQYTEYYASEGGKYDWHHDIDWNYNDGRDRKISLTVQLSDPADYSGGVFQFSDVPQLPPICSQVGTVIAFPSYLGHRVTPVTSGVRRSLVAFFYGPKWR